MGRVFNQLHGGVVNVHMRQLNVRILFGDFIDDFAPQNGSLQNVRFVDGGYLTAALTRGFKCDARDTFNFKAVIHLGIECFFMLAVAFAPFWLTEVDPTGQFTDAQNVEAICGNVGAQWAESFQPLIQFCRTQVAEQFEVLTQRQQRTTLRLTVRRQMFPFRAAYGAKQNGVCLFTAFHCRLRQRLPVVVDRRTADVITTGGNTHLKSMANCFQDFQGLCHHFRTNTVARQNSNMVILRHHTVSLLFSLF